MRKLIEPKIGVLCSFNPGTHDPCDVTDYEHAEINSSFDVCQHEKAAVSLQMINEPSRFLQGMWFYR